MNYSCNDNSRRTFLKKTLLTGALLPLVNPNLFSMNTMPSPDRLKVHIFSKHLQFLNYTDLANAAAEMGFDGVDLSLRPNGHVLPVRVEEDLPKVTEAFHKAGFPPLLMTTAVEDANSPLDKKVLTTAAKLGFKYYRMNWYTYPEGKTIPEAIEIFRPKMKGLGELNRKLGLVGAYQNHAGLGVGSNIWEIWEVLRDADKEHMGCQYDVRHAMVEGFSSWQNGLKLIQPNIKLFTIKDFKFGEKNGAIEVVDVPIGEGIIDLKSYFRLLKLYKINVPFTLHIEYALGGAEHGDRTITMDKKDIFRLMKADLQKVQQLWQEA
ncbi:MAG: sugar phosphate isomerase/epimerase family protein [Flavitalea sp.]